MSEFVETVFREGDNQDRHLVLLTDTAADLIGAVLKPELKTREEPEAHIDIHLRKEGGVLVYYWTAEDEKKWITLTSDDPKLQKSLEADARERPSDLVEQEVLREYIGGF
ncbi:hypothetical protein L3V16_21095 [Brucella ciceri]|uniref:hypothetical protein n=1 Tax=Brucella ciceri TaxID=391287 RepID=UPI000DE3B01E|nr:hypothetical protein [Brucella ciceri]MCH6206324.1 hypothetical protein [Brucella ciceri]